MQKHGNNLRVNGNNVSIQDNPQGLQFLWSATESYKFSLESCMIL